MGTYFFSILNGGSRGGGGDTDLGWGTRAPPPPMFMSLKGRYNIGIHVHFNSPVFNKYIMLGSLMMMNTTRHTYLQLARSQYNHLTQRSCQNYTVPESENIGNVA